MPRKQRRTTRHLVCAFSFACLLFVPLVPLLQGCASHESPYARMLYVAFPPPPDLVELEGAPPSSRYTWISGRYDYNGVEYVWIPGQWQTRPNERATWITGRWRLTQRGWFWEDGHWS